LVIILVVGVESEPLESEEVLASIGRRCRHLGINSQISDSQCFRC